MQFHPIPTLSLPLKGRGPCALRSGKLRSLSLTTTVFSVPGYRRKVTDFL